MSKCPSRPIASAIGLAPLGLIAVLLLSVNQVQAADPPNSPSRSRVGPNPSAALATPEPVAMPAATSPKAAPLAPVDPLDHLRRRLAEKLGGAEAKHDDSGAASPTVKVVNRGAVAEPTAVAPDRLSPAVAAKPRPSPPRLAVARRADTPDRQAGHAAAPAHVAGAEPAHWDYQGPTGPQAWGEMRAEFAACANGQRQSPIDIRDGLKLQLDNIKFNYGPTVVRVIDNGHTVQVNVGAGNTIEVTGRRLELLQFHFHKPSEERIDGRRFDMVAHLVHKDLDGRLGVVAVLLNRGAAQPLIQTIWNNLPLEKGLDQLVPAPVDLGSLLPATRDYYTYMGSLTTPPCTEGVLWMVMKTPVEVSPQQIAIFDRLYPMNARPVQSASGRLIKESN